MFLIWGSDKGDKFKRKIKRILREWARKKPECGGLIEGLGGFNHRCKCKVERVENFYNRLEARLAIFGKDFDKDSRLEAR